MPTVEKRPMDDFWYCVRLVWGSGVVILLIVIIANVSHLHHDYDKNNANHHSTDASLTFSTGCELHTFLDKSTTSPIGISITEMANGAVVLHRISLSMSQVVSGTKVKFFISQNHFCSQTVATLDITTNEITMCGYVLVSKITNDKIYNYLSTAVWEEHGAKQTNCVNDVHYGACISSRVYPCSTTTYQ